MSKELSPREFEVYTLRNQGLRNRQIAYKLCVCEKTVKFHITNINKKLKAQGTIELDKRTKGRGLLPACERR